MTLAERVRALAANSGLVIPKPEAKKNFTIKGMGKRRKEEALIYRIPSHKERKPYEKGVTLIEFSKSYEQLLCTGELTRAWFAENLPD